MYDDSNVLICAVASLSSVVPRLLNKSGKIVVAFSGNLLKQTKVAYNHRRIVNIYVTYKLQKRSNDNPDVALENSLFGAIKITKNFDVSKYSYSGYGIGFDAKVFLTQKVDSQKI